MKKILFIGILICCLQLAGQESHRIENIKNNLEVLALDHGGFNERLKLDISVSKVTLSDLLIAVAKVHGLNLTVDPNIGNDMVVNNFSEVTVADLLVYLCKAYGLDIEFTGNILSIKKFVPPPPEIVEQEVRVSYQKGSKTVSIDVRNEPLERVFRKLMEVSGENLLFSNDIANVPLTFYINTVPMDKAMESLAAVNGLTYTKSRDGFHLLDAIKSEAGAAANAPRRRGLNANGLHYEVLDTINRVLNVDFNNAAISDIVDALSYDLDLDVYTATPLNEAGVVTFNAKEIDFDSLLEHIFESKETGQGHVLNTPPVSTNQNQRQNNRQRNEVVASPVNFTFKKEGNIYFFGTADQLSLRNVEVIQMMHRSVELLGDPSHSQNYRSSGRTSNTNLGNYGNNGLQGGQQNIGNNLNSNRRSLNTQSNSFGDYQDTAEAIVSILPDEIKSELDIRVDYELNSFLVSGPASNIGRFKKFIKEIDKLVPVVLIEVMIIEVKRSSTVETGISWGIGDEPVNTSGKLFPTTDLTLGAKTVNKIIGGFDGFGSFNVGQIVPEFFANIKAMEENGNLKIRSTPKLSTLNGHRANLSIGETTYYVVTNQNYFGSQIPTTSEVRNYHPIDAELAISIKPLVSGNGQVTLDINVIQSDFNGERIENDAPPGLTSREFSSIIRMQNQDLAVLGGLEEKVKNDSGNGVPFLARIPVIKWLFSQRKREDKKQKLTILIKPTVIY